MNYFLMKRLGPRGMAPSEMELESRVDYFGSILNDPSRPLKERFRALFALRNLGGEKAIEQIGQCFCKDESVLLQHELAYCLGQMQDKTAVSKLCSVLDDRTQHAMTRHEAGEALGAIGDATALTTLVRHLMDDVSPDVRETCRLAIQRIQWLSAEQQQSAESRHETNDEANKTHALVDNPYRSIDPTPALETGEKPDVGRLREQLLDVSKPLWDRYQAMFTLRNIATPDAVRALAKGLIQGDSALFRHEIAFVLGQVQSSEGITELKSRLETKSENCMVRHECAEALGAIGTDECKAVLTEFLADDERVVRESCEVALDTADYEADKTEFHFSDSLLPSDETQFARLKVNTT